jgi:hypothetical protein
VRIVPIDPVELNVPVSGSYNSTEVSWVDGATALRMAEPMDDSLSGLS